ncbi:MAG: ParB-like nuclease domain-containing protein [Thermoleophilia bacterium]|nr:ParB-like nuclease domain-containing protein [Thermoleophilia bacterium]
MHPATCTQTETKLLARHVSFAFEPNLQIDRIRDVEGNQVRLIANRAPKAMVDRYAEQMKAGAVFPAIVVNDRHELVDGNTRWIAARRNRRESIAAYVCSDLSALQARSLSVELNQSNGLSMTEEDIHAFIDGAVEEGQVLDTRAYSRMTGVKPAKLSRWVAAKQFQMRALREGIGEEPVQGLSDSVRAALQVAKLRAVFCEATALAVEARVPAAQLNSIISDANSAPSEAEALAALACAREIRTDEVRRFAAGFKGTRRKGTGAALHIGGLLRFETSDLLDVSPEHQEEAFRRMLRLRQRLDGTLARARVEWSLPHLGRPDCGDGPRRDLAQVG